MNGRLTPPLIFQPLALTQAALRISPSSPSMCPDISSGASSVTSEVVVGGTAACRPSPARKTNTWLSPRIVSTHVTSRSAGLKVGWKRRHYLATAMPGFT